MHSNIIIPSSYKREHERSKQIFIIIKKVNFLEKCLKESMPIDIYSDQINHLVSKFKTVTMGIPNFDLDQFTKDFSLTDQFYGIQLLKNPGGPGGNQAAMKILDVIHELDTKLAFDKSGGNAYVSEYKMLFSELTSNYEKLPKSQKTKMRDTYVDTVSSDYQNLLGKENNDLVEEIQLTVIQNNLYRFSSLFRRVIMS